MRNEINDDSIEEEGQDGRPRAPWQDAHRSVTRRERAE